MLWFFLQNIKHNIYYYGILIVIGTYICYSFKFQYIKQITTLY